MMTTEQPIKIFISHSRQDEELVHHLVETIKKFFDIPYKYIRCTSLTGYQLRGGANIPTTLQNEIRNAKVVIGVLTTNSVNSPWVWCELGAAWGLVSNFIPFVAGLDPENIKGPFGVSQVWRLDNIDQIISALDEVKVYLVDDASCRTIPESDRDKALRKVVSIAKKYSPKSEEIIPADELYTLRSNKKPIVQTRRAALQDFKVFQDFKVSRNKGNNVNAVHYLWADTFANGNIKALVITEKEENYLRVWFENGFRTKQQGEYAKGYACNLEVWPPEHVLENKKEDGRLRYTCLQFYARIPKEEINENYLNEVGLSVRLLDRRLTRWVYRAVYSGKGPTQLRVTDDSWQAFKLPLMAPHYALFTASGNHLYLKYDENGQPSPDFTVLAGITFIVGCYSAGQEEPRDGKGVIDIKDIRLINKTAK